MKKIAVVGAGLVGSLQAILMAKKGYDVSVFERREDLRSARMVGGRSINLALSHRGWKALELAGIADEVRAISIPMQQRCMHALDGTLTYQPYGVDGESIYSVSRGELNRKLILLASDFPNIRYFFDRKCQDVNLETNALSFRNTAEDTDEELSFDHVFATDGAFSAVRMRMQKSTRFEYSQKFLDHGYKELVIPAKADGTHELDKNCLHIWPRREFMLIALANLDGSFTCTLFFPLFGETSFDSLKTREEVSDFFAATFPDAVALMPTLLDDYFGNPASSMIMVRCQPWNVEDKVLLMGDSAHAIVPFYGQGMNCGFEDCTVFHEMHESADGNWDGLLGQFSDHRIPDGNAILDLALLNYVEMRDRTADPHFLLRKKIEAKFTRLHPDKWLPLFSQVTLSNIRYSDAIKNDHRQQAIMDEVMARPGIHEDWDEQSVLDHMLGALDSPT